MSVLKDEFIYKKTRYNSFDIYPPYNFNKNLKINLMNKIYRIVWNHVLLQWVAVAETTKSSGKANRSSLIKLTTFAALATGLSMHQTAYAACVSTAYDSATDSRTWVCSGAIPSTYLWSDGAVYAGSGHGITPSSNNNVSITLESGSSSNVTGNTSDGFSDLNPYTGGTYIQNLEIINRGRVIVNPAGGFNSGSQMNTGTIQKQTYHNYGLFQGHEAGVNPNAPSGITFHNYAGATVIGGLGMDIGSQATTLLSNAGTITGQWMNNPTPAQQVGPAGSWYTNPDRKPDHAIAVSMAGNNVIFNQQDGSINGDVAISASTSTLNVSGGVINGDILFRYMRSAAENESGVDTLNLTNGQIKGDVRMYASNDVFNITGGSISGNTYLGDGNDTFSISNGTLTGNLNAGAGNDTATASGGTLIGNTLMGDGDDVVTLTGTVNVTAAPQFDGGVGSDVLNVDGLNLRGFTAASNDGTGNLTETNNSNLTGWETINVKNAGTLKLSNNLFTANNTGNLNVDATSTLDLKGNSPGIFTIFGTVNNSGMMTMADGAADDLTTITGNYTGVAGSQFAIDTVLGNDSSLTDKLVVNGNTSGATALSVTNAGGAGAPTVEGIQVVQVDGASDGTFSLAAPVQAGSYEYTLQKNGVSTPTDGDWYLRSTFVATCANTPSLCPVDPIDPVDPPKPPVYIYRPGVALYVTAQSANADAGFLQMSTLHQRMGEQRDLPTDKPQTWGRLIGAGVSNAGGSRFEYDQFTTGFQFGHDLLHKTSSTGTQQRAGVTVQYAHSSMDAKDRVRPLVGLGEDTGSMNSNSVGLGGYYTRMNQAGAYLDVVSQVNHLTNKFSDSYGGNSKQKGWQFGLSAEVGKPVADLGGWKFEPQAQLSYLHTRYDDFTDRYSNIDGLNASQLRGRLGLRVYKDFMVDNKAAQYYGIVNVHHDFLKAKSVTLHDRVGMGSASVRESYDRTFGEVGLGIQGHIRNNTYVYADARYQRSFKGNKEGAQFNVGIKASF